MKRIFFILMILSGLGCSSGSDDAQFSEALLLSIDDVVSQIQATGAVVNFDGSSVTPNIFQEAEPEYYFDVNNEHVSSIIYDSAELAVAEKDKVSADGTSIVVPGGVIDFDSGPPHWYQKSNVIVLYIGDSAELPQLLSGVFGSQFAGYEVQN